jgi:LysM repeat protein
VNGYNLNMRKLLAGLFLVMLLCACANSSGNATADLTSVPSTPRGYQSMTPRPTTTVLPGVMTIILPSPTPLEYTIAKGDTLSSIAGHFGISVQDLLSANPGVQANALIVGNQLIIPASSKGTPQAIPTPAALTISQARCWPETSGGSWCFALLQNDFAESIENISVQFSLLDLDGHEIVSQAAYGLLDILQAGGSMPLAVHLPAPLPARISVRVQVLTAIRLLPGDTRYLPVMLENTLVNVNASGSTANVSGLAVLAGAETANTLWVLASAYDAAGNVVGLRRWESVDELSGLDATRFDFQISSVGPAISRVDLLAEAKP